MSKVAQPPRTFQDLLLTLQRYWADQGCVILQPYDMEVGAGTFHPAHLPARRSARSPGAPPTCSPRAARPTAATARTRTACSTTTSSRWSSSPRRRDIHRPATSARCAPRHRPAGARRPLRRGRLGVADARRLGPRLGGLAERHGGHAVHLLPAGRRARLPAGHRRDHLRPRAPRDVPAGRRQRLRPGLGRRPAGPRHLRRRLPPERGRAVEAYNFEHADVADAAPALRRARDGVPAAARGEARRCRPTSTC